MTNHYQPPPAVIEVYDIYLTDGTHLHFDSSKQELVEQELMPCQ